MYILTIFSVNQSINHRPHNSPPWCNSLISPHFCALESGVCAWWRGVAGGWAAHPHLSSSAWPNPPRHLCFSFIRPLNRYQMCWGRPRGLVCLCVGSDSYCKGRCRHLPVDDGDWAIVCRVAVWSAYDSRLGAACSLSCASLISDRRLRNSGDSESPSVTNSALEWYSLASTP